MKPRRETCMPKCVRTQIDQVALKTWGGEKTVLTPSKLVRLARAAARIALSAAASIVMVMAQETADCRVTGFEGALFIEPFIPNQEANSEIKFWKDEFDALRLQRDALLESLGWGLFGARAVSRLPVTSTTPPGYTRRGRFWGTARQQATLSARKSSGCPVCVSAPRPAASGVPAAIYGATREGAVEACLAQGAVRD